MLTVAGKIGAREIKVSTNAGADFVFEPSYKLSDLTELEKFVKTNKHLPEIPTAKEMVENGVNLGELNIKLLQKVEELTLHLIEKEKQLEKQTQTNQKQQIQIDQVIKELAAIKQNTKH
jgi:2-methylisocitrate lyase-like PEP mutase family enzyme